MVLFYFNFFIIMKKLKFFYRVIICFIINIMNLSKSVVLFPCLTVLLYGIYPVEGFLNNNPLKQIAITRALQSSVLEIITLNIFDQSSILQQLVCDCEENKFLGVYFIGSLYFGYSFWANIHTETKLTSVPVYYNNKRWIKQLLLMLF